MLQFDYPWLLLLAPLPWLGYRLLPAYREEQAALRVTYASDLHAALQGAGEVEKTTREYRWLIAYWLVWLLLLVAAARPVELAPPLVAQEPTRDLVLAIDLSQSMTTTDYRRADGTNTDRLSAVKSVVSDFIQNRRDDRIGLLVFGDRAFVQATPTRDHATVARLLADTSSGMAGPSTALGDAIGLTTRLLEKADDAVDKVLILLTDGNDTASRVTPEQATTIAARHGIRIHTIAVGDPQTQSDDKVDVESLSAIAKATGGQFFLASDRQALASVYQTLDRLTPHQAKTLSFQPRIEWFWLPVALSLGLLLLMFATVTAGHRPVAAPVQAAEEAKHGH
ncbi:MAG: VWA domain-containing protein [Marinobacter sp.]|uniref:VWA domain-containing protein n=1 Tax=Marinobacter sp. TaxID=50741 RepID=UPI00299E52AE|nr:VWA domain-containing protein [Marinobacter sp.]MDX1755222.1 VWA domain-containing protein [Marinobacter sp.]